MNINFKERKKEIIVISVCLIVFLGLIVWFNSVNTKKAELQSEAETLQLTYDRLKNNVSTEQQLNDELLKLDMELVDLQITLPSNLKNRDVNAIMEDIVKNTSLFNYNSYQISEEQPLVLDGKIVDGINCFEVEVKSFSGTYNQLKNFLNFIANYNIKINISDLTFSQDMNYLTGSFTLLIYTSIL